MDRDHDLDVSSDREQLSPQGRERTPPSDRDGFAAADRNPDQWGRVFQEPFCVTFDTPVVFSRNVFWADNPQFRDILCRREPNKRHRAAVFIDDGVVAAWPGIAALIHSYAASHRSSLELAGDIVEVPGGERCKAGSAQVGEILRHLQERHIDRHSFAIAIGGGAVLDTVGYAAAIFHRGVRHVRLPTTVLAQGDSGIGVKNAINAFHQKNLIGTFSPPWAVINDGAFIDLLPPSGKRDGMAEAIKVALIRDRAFFEWIEAHAEALAAFDPRRLDTLIERSAILHLRQITRGGDPFETGSSRPLDFGHWSAHKLEILTGHALTHGHAVAIGVALDARYSVLAGLLPNGEDERVHRVLSALGFDLWHDGLRERGSAGRLAITDGLREFQEHLGGELTVTLLRRLGEGVDVHALDDALIEQAVAWLAERHQQESAHAA
jgi:3-dehydroquinate synthase